MSRRPLLALTLLTATGCLSNGYQIRRDDLIELSRVPEDQRWEQVRVVQNIGGGDEPPAGDVYVARSDTTVVVVDPPCRTLFIRSHTRILGASSGRCRPPRTAVG